MNKCPYCKQDSGFTHQPGCPNAPASSGTVEVVVRLYQPSSGCEGMDFVARWCDRCEFNDAHVGCPILNATMAHKRTEPAYPNQWRDDPPRCIAYVHRGTLRQVAPEDRLVEPMASLRDWAAKRGVCQPNTGRTCGGPAAGTRTSPPTGSQEDQT